MKIYFLLAAGLLSGLAASSQLPEDILRYSYFPVQGTARNAAIGGAMGSLGGDINATYVNPAGLGFYKTSEFVLSPAFLFNGNKANYRGTDEKSNKSAFNLGTSGFVFGFSNPRSRWTNQAFSIGITQTASFKNFVSYSGLNNYSSYSEQFAEQISKDRIDLNGTLNDPYYAYGTYPAIYTYLVDQFRIKNPNPGADSIDVVRGLPELLLDKGIALAQHKTVETSGGIYEIGLGYAANMDDKIYLGISVGIPVVNYSRYTTFTESDPSGNTDNNFASSVYTNSLTTKGIGLNAKLGLIFKPADALRLGLAVHTPTFYSLTDRESASMTTNTEGYNGVLSASSDLFTNDGGQGKSLYSASTPAKVILSASYVLREVSDTRLQRGFITADIEYSGYSGSRFNADGDMVSNEDIEYYRQLKQVIKDTYKGALNYRLGGELKFNTFMVRLGGAYYSNPYRNSELKSDIKQLSGGVGYRNRGMFIDLTYVQNFLKDINFPYLLSDKSNTFAQQNNRRGNILLTVGFKF